MQAGVHTLPEYVFNFAERLLQSLQGIPMEKFRWKMARGCLTGMLASVFLISMPVNASQQPDPEALAISIADTTADSETLATLVSLIKLKNELLLDIKALNEKVESAGSGAEEANLRQELEKLESDLRATTRNLESIAAGVDLSRLRVEKEEEFNFQKEVFALLKPALDEMKEMTSHVRQKSDLREQVVYYQ